MDDIADILSALKYIPSHDRELWVKIGLAIRHKLGDEGWDVFDAWSRESSNYDYKSALASWRSFQEPARYDQVLVLGSDEQGMEARQAHEGKVRQDTANCRTDVQ